MAYWFSFDELSAISIASSFSENTLHDSFIYRDHPIVGHKRPMELSQTVEERPLKNPKTSHSWNNNSSYHENDQMSSSQSVAYPNYSHLINSNNFTNQQVVTMKPKEETTLSCSSITFAADHHNNLVCHQDSFANQNYMFKEGQLGALKLPLCVVSGEGPHHKGVFVVIGVVSVLNFLSFAGGGGISIGKTLVFFKVKFEGFEALKFEELSEKHKGDTYM
ncbi:hypothetical protein FXO38_22655, partial [Capsicum annuum]